MMAGFADALSPFVVSLLIVSAQASAVVAAVLVVQRVCQRKLAVRWRYALWMLLLLRLLIPVWPQSDLSLFNLADLRSPAAVTDEAPPPLVTYGPPPVMTDSTMIFSSPTPLPPATSNAPSAGAAVSLPTHRPWRWDMTIALVWLVGAASASVWFVLAAWRLALLLRAARPITDEPLQTLLDNCRRQMRIRARVAVLETDRVATPALVGLMRPRILLPVQLRDLPPLQMRFVLLHELAHHKRKDIAVNRVLSALTALHWFNPVIWFAFNRLRSDREPVRDAMVLSACQPADRTDYGLLILQLVEHATRSPGRVGAVALFERRHQLRRRITMIADMNPPRRFRDLIIGLASLLLIACTTLTEAQPAAPPTMTRVYDVRDIPKSHDEKHPNEAAKARSQNIPALLKLIRDSVGDRNEWKANGGTAGSMTESNGNLIVKTTAANHDAIIKLLTQLRSERVQREIGRRPGLKEPERRMNKPISLRYDATPLEAVISDLRDQTGGEFVVNWNELATAGVNRKTPITLKLSSVQADTALEAILKQVSAGAKQPIGYEVTRGLVLISTAVGLERDRATITRVYDIRDVLEASFDVGPAAPKLGVSDPQDPDPAAEQKKVREQHDQNVTQLLDFLRNNAGNPRDWAANGGELNSVIELNGNLIIKAPTQIHVKVLKLLKQLMVTAIQVSIECRLVELDDELLKKLAETLADPIVVDQHKADRADGAKQDRAVVAPVKLNYLNDKPRINRIEFKKVD